MGRMKHVRVSWLPAGLALLLVPAAIGAAEWIDTDGSAVAERAESEDATRARAEADAMARGLGVFLREWLSEAELQRRMPVLQPALFGRASEYVEAVSGVARSKSGLRHFWSGRVEFDRTAIEQELRALGLLSPWAREPLFALRASDMTTAEDRAVIASLRGRLAESGIRLVPADELGTEDADGTWTLHVSRREAPHPFIAGRVWAVTEAVVVGDIGGRPFRADLPVVPALSPPQDLTYALIVDRIIDLWVPLREAARRNAVWQLGPLRFTDHQAWLAFDRRIWADRHLFHDVIPADIRREGGTWVVVYEFMLPTDAEATVAAWLSSAGLRVRREGERRFVVDP